MTFCEKIRNILKDNEFKINSASKLEDFVDLGRSSITAHYSKKGPCPNTEPGLAVQNAIKEKLRINKEWWDTGKGEIYSKEPESTQTKAEKHDSVLLFMQTIDRLIEKNDALVQGELGHLRSNENWFKQEFSKLTSKLSGSNDPQ